MLFYSKLILGAGKICKYNILFSSLDCCIGPKWAPKYSNFFQKNILVGVFSSFFKLFLGLLENKKKNIDFAHLSKTNIYILCPLF